MPRRGQRDAERLDSIRSLIVKVEEHLDKLNRDPGDVTANHWKTEIQNFAKQVERHLHRLGPTAQSDGEELWSRYREQIITSSLLNKGDHSIGGQR